MMMSDEYCEGSPLLEFSYHHPNKFTEDYYCYAALHDHSDSYSLDLLYVIIVRFIPSIVKSIDEFYIG